MNDLKGASTGATCLECLFKNLSKREKIEFIKSSSKKHKKLPWWIQAKLFLLKGTRSNYEIIKTNIKHNNCWPSRKNSDHHLQKTQTLGRYHIIGLHDIL